MTHIWHIDSLNTLFDSKDVQTLHLQPTLDCWHSGPLRVDNSMKHHCTPPVRVSIGNEANGLE